MQSPREKERLIAFYDKTAKERSVWKERNQLYHATLEEHFSFLVPEGASVLELGCGNGDLLAAVKPRRGVGVDFSASILEIAAQRHPHLTFICADAEDFTLDETFDYILLSDLLCSLRDIQQVLRNLKRVCHDRTRLVISSYNFLWEPALKLGERLGFKQAQPLQNWLSHTDIASLLELENFDAVRVERKLLLPKCPSFLNPLANRFAANLPLLNHLDLCVFILARQRGAPARERSVSIILPARNERGNIENAVRRIPLFGASQELLFVEGHSSDGTFEEMERVRAAFPDRAIRILKQSGRGKANAVREGFDAARGEVLMILDADLTTPPEDLPKFYRALADNRGEFINGCRLIYPMEKEAMRFLNLVANRFFGALFSYLLGQRLKDTLCGTKALLKEDYLTIARNRKDWGESDPFGDFDLLFGASRLNLKIAEIPVRYREREYGATQISRFRHGWLLLKMSLIAASKLKFR